MSTPKRPPGGADLSEAPRALAWVGEGIISDTKTIFGILWWAQWGHKT